MRETSIPVCMFPGIHGKAEDALIDRFCLLHANSSPDVVEITFVNNFVV